MASPPELLRRVPLFEGLGPEDLQWIAKATHVRSFAAGESIFEIGEPGRSLYILTAGNVQVLHPNEPTSYQLARLGPGDFLGEMAVLNDSPRSATARAIGAVQALVLEKGDFRQLVLERPDVSLKLLEAMAQRIRKADEQISGLSTEAVRDRLTGLHNRLAFQERLEDEAARVRRYGGSFSIILVDLHDFAKVNEQQGQAVGDQILRWIGRLLNEHTRASDIPFRFEEDTFTILCPWTSAEVAGQVAKRLVALVAEAKPPVGDGFSLSLRASYATCPDHASEGQALYHHAQRALMRGSPA
ncbi:MAG TPA: GGDEF domain-containing protein [Longimicrobiales bacterium]|nr:GGDEF domain-containing protein [Longimicrobiales bacterium]